MTDSTGVPQHFDSPNKGATRGKEGTGRPGQGAAVAAQCHLGQRREIRRLAAGERGAPGVGRQLLLQPEPGGQPVRQRMVEVQSQAELGEQARQEVAAAHVCQLVCQHRAALGAFHSRQSAGKSKSGRRQPIVAGVASSDVSRTSTFLEQDSSARRISTASSRSRSTIGRLRARNRWIAKMPRPSRARPRLKLARNPTASHSGQPQRGRSRSTAGRRSSRSARREIGERGLRSRPAAPEDSARPASRGAPSIGLSHDLLGRSRSDVSIGLRRSG